MIQLLIALNLCNSTTHLWIILATSHSRNCTLKKTLVADDNYVHCGISQIC